MKKSDNIEVFAVPRDLNRIREITGNLYQSLVILGKRANQIALIEKEELGQKLAEFAPKNDTLEEIFDNREQMEISAHYEKLPKPSLVAIEELINDKVYFRSTNVEEEVIDKEKND
ncbi:MAG: RNA polymerase Rpb6 [Bacteroidetes bacterium]|nr:RNA polymerase Rpb6 [Bacteroidota bacterium]MBT5528470.1 RNA polymerase Rpb6 [Cytophagia bacterium]MBT3424783.1 RNA polymerase Rpb6 [Bacteroidota bacterium]MBT3802253.1 RNA polymerase Rpb6 [Bacteroidota bacterium]MBT3935250.1 RNA polymerase Rpb6 [Bacteroidota bacterium]